MEISRIPHEGGQSYYLAKPNCKEAPAKGGRRHSLHHTSTGSVFARVGPHPEEIGVGHPTFPAREKQGVPSKTDDATIWQSQIARKHPPRGGRATPCTKKEKSKSFGSPRSATNSYSILGVKTNSRFRILWEENFLIL